MQNVGIQSSPVQSTDSDRYTKAGDPLMTGMTPVQSLPIRLSGQLQEVESHQHSPRPSGGIGRRTGLKIPGP